VGFTVSRKVGKAVVRNRIRRRLREITRHQSASLATGVDYVVVAFRESTTATFVSLREELEWLLQRARRWVLGKQC
jgi:ribonuclease P protein component